MESGILFYWFGWVIWIFNYFLREESKKQQFLSIWLLMMIAFSNVFITFLFLNFSLGYVILFLGAFLWGLTYKNIIYLLTVSFTLMVGYASFLMWEKEIYFLFLFPKEIFLAFLVFAIIVAFIQGLKRRCMVAIIGSCGGELLYHLLSSSYMVYHIMGSLIFFDTMVLTIGFFIIFEIILYSYIWVRSVIKRYKSQYVKSEYL